MAYYNDKFSWDAPYGDNVIVHTDGAVSVMLHWDGFDGDLLTKDDSKEVWTLFNNVLAELPEGYYTEFHLWREKDATPAKRYLEYSKHIVRGHKFCGRVRKEMAKHLAPYGMSNHVAVVISSKAKPRFAFTAKKRLMGEAHDAEALLAQARIFAEKLPGGRIVSVDEYCQRIKQSADRSWFRADGVFRFDPAYSLRDQLIAHVPKVEDRRCEMAGHFTKVLLVYKYPMDNPGWIVDLVQLRCAMHISHIVEAVDTRAAVTAADTQRLNAEGMLVGKADAFQEQKIDDLQDFQTYVIENHRLIIRNLYVIHLHGDQKTVETAARAVRKLVCNGGGELRDADYIQRYYFRIGLPGQGYRGDKFRPDEHHMVANFLPVQVWPQGDERAETLRLHKSGQLQTYSVTDKAVGHTFVGGMTRSGKDALYVTETAETAGFGVNIKLLEIGGSYHYVLEGYEGKYHVITPDNVINPLPPYSAANQSADIPLSPYIVGNTMDGIAFLLTDNKPTLTRHQRAAGESALQHVYASPDSTVESPTLEHLEYELGTLSSDYHSPELVTAGKEMASFLSSFLNSTGRMFKQQSNLDLSGDFVGIDLRDVWKADKNLSVFFLVFLGLRFAQDAFINRSYTRIILNELYELVRLAPEIVGALASAITRMGGKERSFLTILTQHTSEVEALDSAVLAQMPFRYLMYVKQQHDYIAERLNLTQGSLDAWRRFEYPEGRPYREMIYCHGDTYQHLDVRLPEFCLNIAESSPDALNLKDAIALETPDVFVREALFKERWNKLRGAA